MHERQKWIVHWREENALSAQQVPEALRLAGIPPSRQEWRLWIDRLLLWLGVVSLLAGLIFLWRPIGQGWGAFQNLRWRSWPLLHPLWPMCATRISVTGTRRFWRRVWPLAHCWR